MNNFYIIHSKQKISVQQFQRIFASIGLADLELIQVSDYELHTERDETLVFVLDATLSLIQSEFQLDCEIIIVPLLCPWVKKVVSHSTNLKHQRCNWLADCVADAVTRQDREVVAAIRQGFQHVSQRSMQCARMYLLCECQAKQAADQMYMHRNTFNYSLRRFIDESGLDIRHYHQARLMSVLFATIFI